ncbi:MAG TPA: HDIG domain-containing protein [Longimicrobiales bacterium]|nr:HDIG domain-containing protein [Longimicrobiales bacterium]
MLILLALSALVTLLFPPSVRMSVGRYEVGQVAREDVIARIPFSVPKSAEALARDRVLAMESVPPTFDFFPAAGDTMASRLGAFFDQLDSAGVRSDRAGVERVLRSTSLVATPSQVDELLDADTRGLLRRIALTAATDFVPQGLVDAGQALNITTPTVTVRDGDAERTVPTEDLVTQREFFESTLGLLAPSSPPDLRNLLRLILIRHIEFSYTLNVVATELDRDAAARSVLTTKDDVLEGQAIVRAADPIGSTQMERLNAYEEQLRAQGMLEVSGLRLAPLAGAAIVNTLLLAIFGLVLFFFRVEVYAQFRWLLLQALLVAVYFGAAAAIARNGLAPEWLPIAFVALPVGVLWDTRMSLVLVLILATITGTLPPFGDYGIMLTVAATGAAAAMSVRAVRRRSETWLSIAIIAGTAGLVLLGHGLATGHEMADVARATLYSTGNATVSALLAIGFLFVFELFTGITTDQTLLEWADPTRDLLKRLSLEAPGTYAHTINVANLSEAAANAIGANGLLCRVGVYYHDVGKMLKPHYFAENQPDARNPHDKLKPETSAAIIREHVTEGERLARDAKVPDVVVDFILEHHGTQRIGFFYEKALEEAGEELDEARFAYPGPKPRSRETAIVMLADSCESAARAMKNPSADRVRDLIRNIVQGKVKAGQLDEAPLTLAEIAQIESQFVKILGGVLHRRIEYPTTKHLTDAPGQGESASQPPPSP